MGLLDGSVVPGKARLFSLHWSQAREEGGQAQQEEPQPTIAPPHSGAHMQSGPVAPTAERVPPVPSLRGGKPRQWERKLLACLVPRLGSGVLSLESQSSLYPMVPASLPPLEHSLGKVIPERHCLYNAS